MTEHSKIGPSSLHRILACPASHGLSTGLPEGKSSFYAAEGTLCHRIVESDLIEDFLAPDYSLGSSHSVDGHTITVDQDMLDGADMMVAFCASLVEGAERTWVEQRVDLGHLWGGNPPEPIFGTVDFGAYHRSVDTLYCVDLKYGRLPVIPHDNPQQNAYATGMVEELGFTPSKIVNVIIQPRDHTSATPIKAAEIYGLDLLVWAHDVLVPGVDAAFGPAPVLSPGDHCRFCPAKLSCPALPVLAQEQAKADFSHVPVSPIKYTDAELAKVLDWADVIKMWIEEVRAEASGRLEGGSDIPNWKLVPKRAIRKWSDAAAAATAVGHHDMFMDTKIKSPTQIEKIDKDTYNDLLGRGLIEKTSSGTTLAPENDPRERVKALDPKDDFDPV